MKRKQCSEMMEFTIIKHLSSWKKKNSSGKSYKATYLAPGVTVYCLLVGDSETFETLVQMSAHKQHQLTGPYYSALGPTRAKHSNSIFGAPSIRGKHSPSNFL